MIQVARIGLYAGLFVLCGLLAVFAQADGEGPDYDEFRSVAVAADQALANAQSADEELQKLRDLLNEWREVFLDAEGQNASRVRTVESQLEALGPAPEEGADPEPAQIAQRRAELNALLNELLVPGRRASEALSQTNGLISEIDSEFRSRQADALFTRGPSPLNPALWPQVFEGVARAISAVSREIAISVSSSEKLSVARNRIPAILALLAVAVVMIGRGRSWSEKLTARVQSQGDHAGAYALGFLVSLLQIVIPLLGLWALAIAVVTTGLLGPTGNGLVTFAVLTGSAVYAGRWMAPRIFPKDVSGPALLELGDRKKSEGRFYVVALFIIFPLFLGVTQYAEAPETDPQIIGLLSFPLILLSAGIYFRLGSLLLEQQSAAREASAADVGPGFLSGVAGWLGRLLRLIAIVAPLAAAVGYINLADALVLRSMAAITLVAFLVILHYVIQDLYALVTRRTPEEVKDALFPVLLTLVMTLASTPVFALILGARWSDIADFWIRLRQGIKIGDLTISPTAVIVLLIVFAIGFFLTRFVQATLRTVILPKTSLDQGARTAVVSGMGYVGITIAALVAITTAGLDLSSLAIVAGALSVGIGFGLQTVVSNFVSGIILLVERPISEGDWIEVGPNMGIVKDISVRATRVETFDRRDVIIPNSDLVSGTVTNWTRNNNAGRIIVRVGVSYDSDSRRVEQILREIAEEHPLVVLNPPPAVFFRNFGDNALEFEVRAILRDINFMLGVQSEISHEILRRFREERINIPFPQRDVWLRRPGDTEDVKGAQMTEDYGGLQLGSGDAVVAEPADFGDADGDAR